MGKISFFLMTQKGFDALNSFIDTYGPKSIDCVISSRDEKINRDYYIEIKNLCKDHNISFYDRKEDFKILSQYSFAVSWRWLIHGVENLITLHDSILPKYRGFAPLVSALINGETEIGVTALFSNEEFDRGDIILQVVTTISYPIKIKEAINLISKNYVELVLEISKKVINGEKISAIKQDESKASYSLWRDEEDYKINWSNDAEFILRFIDAVSEPYKGAFCYLNNQQIRILSAEIEDDLIIENRTPGKVLFNRNGFPSVVCGKGLLKINCAVYESDNTNVIPLIKFRSRFR